MTAAGKLWKLAGELRRLERERRRVLYRKRVARRLAKLQLSPEKKT